MSGKPALRRFSDISWRIRAEASACERARSDALARRARRNWERAGAAGIRLRVGDGTLGWPEEAPFSAILVGAASPSVPRSLLGQLPPGGRMVIPVGSAVRQVLKRLVRTDRGARVEDHDACTFVRLVGREGFEA